MLSSVISKIEKARRYSLEKDRIQFNNFKASIRGDNRQHLITYEYGQWSCDCVFFTENMVCSHTMAFQRLLEPMLL
ncbi:hypothetical protein FIM04_03155 [SAR202 cluster bacterium AC-409-J13_OGT_754m]|nr:hypothetical protein [SAR202 cluster bacterium AC-409-J13_OGT_754m]